LVFGGEALSYRVLGRILESGSPCQVVNHYGPTETTVGKLLHMIKPDGGYEQKGIPIGRPFSNTRVYVLDAGGKVSATGVAGELYIGGKGVARGYLNRADLTSERFIESLFQPGERLYRTGDLVRWLPEGNIEYLGRVDDQVKIRGYRVELGEIEKVMSSIEGVGQSVVVVREDSMGQKRLAGYYLVSRLSREKVSERLRELLPDYMVPSSLTELDSFPLTGNGKIDKRSLPEPDNMAVADKSHIAPQGAIAVGLVGILEELLEVSGIGMGDNFFELGGHSLLAIRLISAIRKELGIEVTIGAVFDNSTIGDLCSHLASGLDRSVL
ncbi:non-ribosomal peptide synthetase, partial [Dyadobacter sp. OTU695]|uniref:non-ribosomal peptide synthetase n=1 Tax=Dyadobacter sp. OTU695 TaxID=3043860 RepID=UPI00313E8BDA